MKAGGPGEILRCRARFSPWALLAVSGLRQQCGESFVRDAGGSLSRHDHVTRRRRAAQRWRALAIVNESHVALGQRTGATLSYCFIFGSVHVTVRTPVPRGANSAAARDFSPLRY